MQSDHTNEEHDMI